MTRSFVSKEEADTIRFAAALGRHARPGDLVCLSGPLGGGKTTFVRGFAHGAGFGGGVASPTFTLARRYPARRAVLHHLDLYRVGAGDLANLALEEYLDDPSGACLIEWPEAARALLPEDRLEVSFAHRRGGGRTVRLTSCGPRAKRLMRSGSCGLLDNT